MKFLKHKGHKEHEGKCGQKTLSSFVTFVFNFLGLLR